jgi:hypothetical protein
MPHAASGLTNPITVNHLLPNSVALLNQVLLPSNLVLPHRHSNSNHSDG